MASSKLDLPGGEGSDSNDKDKFKDDDDDDREDKRRLAKVFEHEKTNARAGGTSSSASSVSYSENNSTHGTTTIGDPSQHAADVTRATRNSMLDAVGAFHVEGVNSRGGTSGNGEEPQPISEGSMAYTNENLPPNIDIIAEATLVVEFHADSNSDDDGDANTLGLRWGDGPRLGGADEMDDASVAISTITTPTIPTIITHPQEAVGDIESGGTAAVQRSSSGNTDTVDNAAAASHNTLPTVDTGDDDKKIYEATLIKDGPLAFLQTKSGRNAAGISGILIILLSIGLAVGLTRGSNSTTTTDADISGGVIPLPEDYGRVPTQKERDDGVLAFTGGDFCVESNATFFPQYFYDSYPTTCVLGGILHQAIANAQRRPHPFCEDIQNLSVAFIPGGEPITKPDPHLCQITNMSPDISLLNVGAIRSGELPKDSPIKRKTITNFMPFASNKIAYLRLTSDDLVKILNNALNYITQDDPWNFRHMAAFPFASGLRYDVNFSAPKGEKVANIETLFRDPKNPGVGVWIPIESSSKKTYWIVTNDYIANGGDGYMDGVEPAYIAITNLYYTEELIQYLEELDGAWMPPTPEEMSIKAFDGNAILWERKLKEED